VDKHVYVERADPDAKGYEPGTRRHHNVISRYRWANQHIFGTIVDMPCGMGWGASYISYEYNRRLIGLDICPDAIKKAKSLYPRIEFIVGNMLDTPFPDNFIDSVICCEGFEHVGREDQFRLMEEIHRITRPKGLVMLTVPIAKFKGDHTGNKFHLYEPTLEEVEETFYGKFAVVGFMKPNVARFVLEAIK
jgi:ubiquinone/menaquinone biosynthesis C-methylase UbiE